MAIYPLAQEAHRFGKDEILVSTPQCKTVYNTMTEEWSWWTAMQHAAEWTPHSQEQQHLTQNLHFPDATLSDIQRFELGGPELWTGGYPWRSDFQLLPPNDEIQLDLDPLDPWSSSLNPWSDLHDRASLSDTANIYYFPNSLPMDIGLPYTQLQLDDLSSEFMNSAFMEDGSILPLNKFMSDPFQQIYDRGHICTAALHEPHIHTETVQGPWQTKEIQQTTSSQLSESPTAQNMDEPDLGAEDWDAEESTLPVRKPFSPEDRSQTADTRRRRACMQCRQNRLRVSEEN